MNAYLIYNKESSMKTAYLSNEGRYTIFTVDDTRIMFIGPYSLERYVEIVNYDYGYIEVLTKYSHSDELIEEYIDLLPVLDNLYMDTDEFLRDISKVEVRNEEFDI